MTNSKRLSGVQKFKRLVMWLLADFLILIAAYLIAFSARLLSIPSLDTGTLVFMLVSGILFLTMIYLHKGYRVYWYQASSANALILLRSMVWAGATLTVIDIIFLSRPVPLSVLWVAMLLSFGGVTAIRYRSRLLEWRWKGFWQQEMRERETERVLIVGAGESGHNTAIRLKRGFRDAHYEVCAFVDDDANKQDMLIEGAQVLGFTQDIPEIVSREKIDLIVVAIHNISGAKLRQILQSCEASLARVKLVPDMQKILDKKLNRSFLRDVQPEDIIGRKLLSHNEAVDLCVIANRVVLVTGAAGSIGSELARQILRYHKPTKLILLDNNESGLYDLHHELLAEDADIDIETALVDISLSENLKAAFASYRPQIVFHAAAYKHVPMLEQHPNEALRVNIGGTLKVAEAAMLYQVERFVLISTDKAVNPSSVMGASKRICELIIYALGMQNTHKTLFTAVRFGNVLGSRGSVVPLFNRQIDNGGPVTVTDKRMTRYFMSITEAVNLVIHAAAMTNGNDIFVLKMGEVVKIDDLAQRMIRLHGLRPDIDVKIEYTGVRPGEKLHEAFHAEFESLRETLHPSIMKLDDWKLVPQSLEFMTEVYQLVQKGFHNDSEALGMLRSLCGLSVELGKTGD
jgi:FlaA1/EpsC-like NDP-sugar epimerase